ncbi:histidine kinase [Ralstonia mannitolilytica]|nr:histidine kinase [Ralstonia mannitolilytica]
MQARPAQCVCPDRLYAAMQPTASTPADIAARLPAQVIAALTELFGNDLQQWRFIIDLFSDTVEQDLSNLEKAIRGGEDAHIIEAAHRIVGSARMLGHLSIGDAARAIERTAQGVGPHHERTAAMHAGLAALRGLVDQFRQAARDCGWPDAPAASA